jgi:hypothetical protein
MFLRLVSAGRTKRYFVSVAYGKVSDKEPPFAGNVAGKEVAVQ